MIDTELMGSCCRLTVELFAGCAFWVMIDVSLPEARYVVPQQATEEASCLLKIAKMTRLSLF